MKTKNTKRMRQLTAATLASATALLGATRASAVTELIPGDPPTADSEAFGYSIAANPSVALVGACAKSDTYNYQGAAYLFDAASGTQLQKLTHSDPAQEDDFGISVALNDSVALVGAQGKNTYTGAAYLFDIASGNEIKLTPSDPAAILNYFGWSVALNDSVALVGAQGKNAAYLFDLNGNQLKKLTHSDPVAQDSFGWSVALNSRYAVVGAYRKNNNQGAVYIFDLADGAANAVQVAKLTSPNAPATERFGNSVAIDEQNNVYIGAYGATVNGFSLAGKAYKFTCVEAGLEDPNGPGATWVHIDNIGVTAGNVALDWAFAPVTNVLKSSMYESEIHVSTNLVDWLPTPLKPTVTRGLLDEGVTVPKSVLPDSDKMFFKVRAVK
ncbi:MAG: FG-GAP repeat protein [Kiritimatiellaeota bacterium]|nr:FG-GAP repeat protein [Kiritimatiellota bacterium]